MQAPKDNVLIMYLVKHLYILEMIKESLKAQQTKPQLYNEVLMIESEISKATEKELAQYGISSDHIPPNLTSLVVENYIAMESNDNYKTIHIRLLEKGIIAGTSGEFWQKMEGRERDLLQVQLTRSTKSTNRWIVIFTAATVLVGIAGLLKDCGCKKQSDSQNLKIESPQQEIPTKRTDTFPLKGDSSIQTTKIDTPIPVPVKKP